MALLKQMYWNGNGKHQAEGDRVGEAIPMMGECPKDRPALERLRVARNCYYDLYNNGLWNRAAEFRKVFGFGGTKIAKSDFKDFDLMQKVEDKMDAIILAAVKETWAVHGALYDDLNPSRIRPPEDMKNPSLVEWGCHKPGDAIWYRQHSDDTPIPANAIWYRQHSDDTPIPANGCRREHRGKWRSSLFMPRWASRLRLPLKSVRVERVQDISDADAWAEGVQDFVDSGPTAGDGTVRGEFAALCDSINGTTYPFSSNPRVWVLEFPQYRAQA